VVGSADRCADDPEDADGFEDGDGCPDLDNDGDGIVDLLDQCAGAAETINGFDDADGCADEVPEAVQRVLGVLPIEFAGRSANLAGASKARVAVVAELLKAHPSLRVKLAGHTDNQGRPMANLELSARRALAVKAVLVQNKVAGDRIETVGYGADNPIADNATEAGRKQNRRIELSLIVPAASP
jgi:OOP family OmpA-OmpF porin